MSKKIQMQWTIIEDFAYSIFHNADILIIPG